MAGDRAGVGIRVCVIAAHRDARRRPPTPVGRSPPRNSLRIRSRHCSDVSMSSCAKKASIPTSPSTPAHSRK